MKDENQPTRVMLTAKGPATIVSTDGQNATLHAGFVLPPGAPLSGKLEGHGHELRIKVHGCRRISGQGALPPDHDLFEVTGRWVNLSREARLILLGQ